MSNFPSHVTSAVAETAVLLRTKYMATSEVQVRTLIEPAEFHFNTLLHRLHPDALIRYVALFDVYRRILSFTGRETPPQNRKTPTKPQLQSF